MYGLLENLRLPSLTPTQALKKELADLQRDNEAMARELSSRDVRGLREQVAAQHAQLKEARAAEEELGQLAALSSRLPRIRAEAEVLRAEVSDMEALQRELEALREVEPKRVQLLREVSALQSKVHADES